MYSAFSVNSYYNYVLSITVFTSTIKLSKFLSFQKAFMQVIFLHLFLVFFSGPFPTSFSLFLSFNSLQKINVVEKLSMDGLEPRYPVIGWDHCATTRALRWMWFNRSSKLTNRITLATSIEPHISVLIYMLQMCPLIIQWIIHKRFCIMGILRLGAI